MADCFFYLWASGGLACDVVPGSIRLARHEPGPRARAWAAGRARGLARHGPLRYWAGLDTARLRTGQPGLRPGPGRAARMAIYSRIRRLHRYSRETGSEVSSCACQGHNTSLSQVQRGAQRHDPKRSGFSYYFSRFVFELLKFSFGGLHFISPFTGARYSVKCNP